MTVQRRASLVPLVLGLSLFRTSAEAQDWRYVGAPVEAGYINCFAQSDSGVQFLGGAPTWGIVTRTFGGIFRMGETGGWQRILPYVSAQAFAIPPATSSLPDFSIFAVASSNVYVSNDGGRTWTWTPLPGSALATSVAAEPDGALLAGTTEGTFKNFYTLPPIWQTTSGMEGFAAKAFAFEPSSPDRVYAAALNGETPWLSGGIFRSDDAGSSWIRLDPVGFTLPATAIAVDPISPRILYAVAASQLFRSDDGGQSWVARGGQDLAGLINGVVIHPDDPLVLFCNTSSGAGVYRSLDRGDTWAPYNDSFPAGGDFEVTALEFEPRHPGSGATLKAATYPTGIYVTEAPVPDTACQPSSEALCLGRFRVSVEWQASPLAPSQPASAVGVTSDSGYFWFFDSSNVELTVKILDGRDVNGNFWVFYGALSDVAYTITVEDMQTGNSKTYTNPWGLLASEADTGAFPVAGSSSRAPAPRPSPRKASRGAAVEGSCSPGPSTLCLNDGRFRVEADWQPSPTALVSSAQAVALTTDTGYFWFFGASNIELVVKVLDGRGVNDHFWVFYGGLSNLEYTIKVTDTVTGIVRSYPNPPGELASVADTTAF